MGENAPTVSVVIVTYKVRDYLRDCLRSVFANLSGLSLEVWVVDNNSRDSTPAMVEKEFPAVRLIVNPTNTGFARAANQALAQARGRFLLLLNPDAALVGDSLSLMVSCLQQHPEVGVVGGAVHFPDGRLDPACHRGLPTPFAMLAKALGLARLFPRNRRLAAYNMLWLDPNQEAQVEAVSGSCLMVRRDMLEKIGLLDERFFLYIEDVDLCVRASAAGWQVLYFPKASITHRKGASSCQVQDLARLALHHSYLAYYHKHWGRSRPALFRWFTHAMVYVHSGFDRRLLASPADALRFFQETRQTPALGRPD